MREGTKSGVGRLEQMKRGEIHCPVEKKLLLRVHIHQHKRAETLYYRTRNITPGVRTHQRRHCYTSEGRPERLTIGSRPLSILYINGSRQFPVPKLNLLRTLHTASNGARRTHRNAWPDIAPGGHRTAQWRKNRNAWSETTSNIEAHILAYIHIYRHRASAASAHETCRQCNGLHLFVHWKACSAMMTRIVFY